MKTDLRQKGLESGIDLCGTPKELKIEQNTQKELNCSD